jgi:hypothetical protein
LGGLLAGGGSIVRGVRVKFEPAIRKGNNGRGSVGMGGEIKKIGEDKLDCVESAGISVMKSECE